MSGYELPEEFIKKGRALAWLSYFGVLLIIPAVLQRNNPYTVYHVKQGLALMMVSAALVLFCYFVPMGFYALCSILSLILFAINIIGIYNAVAGKVKPLPIIGFIGEKLDF